MSTKKEDGNSSQSTKRVGEADIKDFEGYPLYPPTDDIYSKLKNENDIDPEQPSQQKTPNEENEENNELDFSDAISDEDLDVPGADLDDAQENIGSEDEENNYYSIGGDAHNDLEEDKGV